MPIAAVNGSNPQSLALYGKDPRAVKLSPVAAMVIGTLTVFETPWIVRLPVTVNEVPEPEQPVERRQHGADELVVRVDDVERDQPAEDRLRDGEPDHQCQHIHQELNEQDEHARPSAEGRFVSI